MALKGRGGRRSSSKADKSGKTGPDPGGGNKTGFGDHRPGQFGMDATSVSSGPTVDSDPGGGSKETKVTKDVSFKEALAEKFKPVSDFLSGIKKTQAYQDIAEAADTVKDFGLSTSPTLSGVLTAANLANFAGTKLDEEGNIKTGFFGKPGVSTYGDLDLGNYSFDQRAPFGNVTDEIGTLKDLADMQQGFLGAGMQFDSEGNFTGTDFDSLKDYADAMGMTYQGEDLEALASEVGGSVGQGNDRVPVIPDPEDPYEGDEEASAMYQQYLEDGYPEDLARYLVDELGVFGLD